MNRDAKQPIDPDEYLRTMMEVVLDACKGMPGDEFAGVVENVIRDASKMLDRYRAGLGIIAGRRQCLDNLMSNADVAEAALSPKSVAAALASVKITLHGSPPSDRRVGDGQ